MRWIIKEKDGDKTYNTNCLHAFQLIYGVLSLCIALKTFLYALYDTQVYINVNLEICYQYRLFLFQFTVIVKKIKVHFFMVKTL